MIGRLTISLAALRHNAQALRTLVGPKHAAFVLKANAYGHGLVECALAVEPLAAKLCVYALEEAVALRDGGVTAPILVLGPVPYAGLDAAVEYKTEIALWNTGEFARCVAAAAHKRHTRIKAHIKLNTGLNRLGLEAEALADCVEDFLRMSGIEIEGIFSHLASAEEIDSPYTTQQLERFSRAYTHAEPILASHGVTPIRHIAASAAAMLWPQTRLDMSRFGIALYGLWPSPQTREAMNGDKLPLQPVMRYETSLAVVRTVAAGTPIGYGTTFHAPREMRIGVLPLGYSDGISRLLSNRGSVLIDAVRCPIIGRVAMNMCTVDLSHAPSAQVGSTVTLIGRDGEAEITADDWGTWAETINYEIVTAMPSTLTRDFLDA